MTIRARLYDARGEDRDFDLTHDAVGEVSDRRLLWVDLDDRNDHDLARLASALELEDRIVRQLRIDGQRARLLRFPGRIVVTLGALDRDGDSLLRSELDVIVGRNLVVTVHDGRLGAIEDFKEELKEESVLGQLDAGAFMTGLVDAVLATYFREIDDIDRQIEALDQLALKSVESNEFLGKVVAIRRRIALVRRALVPNREALGPLVRPDFEVHEDVVRAWPGTIDRLERAIDAIEKSRELLVGSFDIYLGRAAQRSNDVMKVLTILSAIALPAVVLAGVMGMNFQLGFFDRPDNFFFVVGAMLVFATALIVVARWRHWL
jgi:magnesium transporter